MRRWLLPLLLGGLLVVVAAPVASAGSRRPLRVSVAGDSIALSIQAGISGDRQEMAWIGCGLESVHGESLLEPNGLNRVPPGCPDWLTQWAAYVKRERPDVVVLLVGVWDMFDREVDGRWIMFGSRESDQRLSRLLDRAVAVLGSSGARVALLTMPYANPGGVITDVGYRLDPARVDHWNTLLRAAATRHPKTATLVDLKRFASPRGFTATISGVAARKDNPGDSGHFTDAGARLVASWLLPRLRAISNGN